MSGEGIPVEEGRKVSTWTRGKRRVLGWAGCWAPGTGQGMKGESSRAVWTKRVLFFILKAVEGG